MPATTDFHVTVFEAIPSPIFIVDREFSVIDFNTVAAKLPNSVVFNALRRLRNIEDVKNSASSRRRHFSRLQ